MSPNEPLSAQSRRLEQRLNAIPVAILEALRPALMRSGEDVARYWRTLAPDDPNSDQPDYRSSITVTGPGETTPPYAEGGGTRTAKANQVLVTGGDEGVRYGHILEFGSSKMEAQPSMLPAWRIAKPKILPRLARAGTAAIKKVARK